MQKPAGTRYPLHDLLRQRWSPVGFSDQLLTREHIGSLFEAARWAPSSYNEQPWSYIIATRDDAESFKRLLSCLVEANQEWARHAPLLGLSIAKRHFDRNGKENQHAWYDVGQSLAHLSVQALALGLYVHQMAGFLPDQARNTFAIPETHEPASAFAVGHYGDFDQLPEALKQRDQAGRQRRQLDELVFSGNWGTPAGLDQS